MFNPVLDVFVFVPLREEGPQVGRLMDVVSRDTQPAFRGTICPHPQIIIIDIVCGQNVYFHYTSNWYVVDKYMA